MAIVIISAIAGGSVHAEERNGWKLEWTGATSGNYSEELDCVSTLPSGSCSAFSGEIGITGQSSGSLILDEGGVVLSGSSEGYSSQFWQTSQNGECYPAEAVTVPNEYSFLSESSLDLWGPSIGEQITIYERASESGSNEVYFNASYDGVCYSFAKESGSGTDSSCEPYDYTTVVADETYDPCPGGAWGTAGWATGIGSATDERNLVFSGTTSEVAGYLPAGLFHNVSQVPYTNTLSMTATKIPLPSIHGIELTQAMQIYEKLENMANTLGVTGSPPIPLVAHKPLAIRVVLDKPVVTVKAIIEVFWNGARFSSQNITQSPTCNPPDMTGVNKTIKSSRQNRPGCKTADFIVGGRPDDENQPLVNKGENRLIVKLYSDDPFIGNELLNEYEFVINAKESDTVMLGAVNICATRIAGRWQCLATPVRDLLNGTVLMSKTYPTDEVLVVPTGHQVRLEIVENANTPIPDYNPDGTADEWDCFDSRGEKILDGAESDNLEDVDIIDFLNGPALKCEKDMWGYVVLARINRLYTYADTLLEASGIRKYYFGLVKPNDLLSYHGLAYGLGRGRAAISESTDEERTEVDFRGTVAHEVGHLLGLPDLHDGHADADIDRECDAWNATVGPPELYLFSDYEGVIKQEVPFDVTRNKAILPFVRYDMMSYCLGPVWASPLNYEFLFNVLRSPEAEGNTVQKPLVSTPNVVDLLAAPVGIAGEYWLVSGFVDENSAFLDTIFALETFGTAGVGEGSHRLEVLDQAGAVLFNREFTPVIAHPLPKIPIGELPEPPRTFAELIPVQASAAKITIRDATGIILAEEPLGGLEPQVTLVFPIGGEQINGEQTLMWTATDDDSDISNLVYWVQYSGDGGNTWITLAQGLQEPSLVVDFDDLPGASGTAMVRILASDRANTGSATSGAFTVGKKLPTVDILLPEVGDVTKVGGLVFFEGYGYDLDDGVLPNDTHSWSSDRDGDIGVGYKVSTSSLSEGQHNIRLGVTDSDSNVAFADVQVLIGEIADEDGDGVSDAQDQCPGTPAGEAVDSDGCSASQLDEDGDGVSDALDQCVGTPAGEAVDASGCSASQRDTDGDGVSDALDQCAGTPAGTSVGSNGCPVSQSGGGGLSKKGGGSFGFGGLFVLGLIALRRGESLRSNARSWPKGDGRTLGFGAC